MHQGAGNYNLDNLFFLDMATSQKWVSSKVVRFVLLHTGVYLMFGEESKLRNYCFHLWQHMKVLVDFLAERHAEVLKDNRAMFVELWFVEYLVGKKWLSKEATYKARVFSDPRLAGYLTREGKKLGVDVDNVYTPMFWGTNH